MIKVHNKRPHNSLQHKNKTLEETFTGELSSLNEMSTG